MLKGCVGICGRHYAEAKLWVSQLPPKGHQDKANFCIFDMIFIHLEKSGAKTAPSLSSICGIILFRPLTNLEKCLKWVEPFLAIKMWYCFPKPGQSCFGFTFLQCIGCASNSSKKMPVNLGMVYQFQNWKREHSVFSVARFGVFMTTYIDSLDGLTFHNQLISSLLVVHLHTIFGCS